VNSTRTKGGPKSGKSCEQKYRAVRQFWITFLHMF
jgi:hypothetical protein